MTWERMIQGHREVCKHRGDCVSPSKQALKVSWSVSHCPYHRVQSSRKTTNRLRTVLNSKLTKNVNPHTSQGLYKPMSYFKMVGHVSVYGDAFKLYNRTSVLLLLTQFRFSYFFPQNNKKNL